MFKELLLPLEMLSVAANYFWLKEMIYTLAVLAYGFAHKPVFLEYQQTTAWMLDENSTSN